VSGYLAGGARYALRVSTFRANTALEMYRNPSGNFG
jgi:hypothetical protein